MKEKIKQLAQAHAGEFVANRRYLHQNPELSYQEYNTQKYVAERLKEVGIMPTSIANTGLVATIEGRNPSSKVVALRADMDALQSWRLTMLSISLLIRELCTLVDMMFTRLRCWVCPGFCITYGMNLRER